MGWALVGLLALWAGCSREGPAVRIGVAFETLQTEYWVASFEAVRAELDRRGIEMIEAVADNDANRQLEQIHTFIARGVDGILVAPKDATTVVPMIRAANEAGIPIVIYNRPPATQPVSCRRPWWPTTTNWPRPRSGTWPSRRRKSRGGTRRWS